MQNERQKDQIINKDDDFISPQENKSQRIKKNTNGFLRKKNKPKPIEDNIKDIKEVNKVSNDIIQNITVNELQTLPHEEFKNVNNLSLSQHKKPQHSKNYKKNNKSNSNYIQQPNKNINNTPSIIQKENPLISYMRQKSGFNPSYFWNQLEEQLKDRQFSELTDNIQSLISYAALYSKEDIYAPLLQRFGEAIPTKEYETYLLSYCMNKSVEFLNSTLESYEKYYTIDVNFVNAVIQKSTKMSYRKENNQVLMSWLDKHMSLEHYPLFLSQCLLERNTVLFEECLDYKNIHTYLKNNYDNFSQSIQLLGKKHTVEKSFTCPSYELETKENLKISPADIEKSIHNMFISESDKKTDSKIIVNSSTANKTEVVIKKKKKII